MDNRNILVEFYHSTNGDGWFNNTNWLTDKPISLWHGISVNSSDTDYVTKINLPLNNLQGNI